MILCPSGLFDEGREVLVKDLLQELQEVTDQWFNLGISLKIPHMKLKEIEQDYDNVKECKMEMILLWRQLCIPTWTTMVTALAEIGMKSLALKIANKYSEWLFFFCVELVIHIFTCIDLQLLPSSLKDAVEQLESEKVWVYQL